jgi:pilus assembly protein CpaB
MVKGYFDEQSVALERERTAAAQVIPTVQVLAVKNTVSYGSTLRLEDLQFVHYAEAHLPEGVFRTQEELFPEGNDVHRIVLRQMDPNEPVLASKVTAPGEDAGITTRIGRGMRAFAIRVDVTSGVSGFLRPGDTVDVYWSGSTGADRESITKLIQSGLKLVAVDQTSDGSRNEAAIARTVTVEVTPQQVAALAQAQATGSLSLALVGLDDDTVAEAIQVNQRSLLGIAEQQIVEVERKETCSIRTRRAGEAVDIAIPCAN